MEAMVDCSDNPDGYVELGRCWIGHYIESKRGYNRNWGRKLKDASLVNKSDGGQISSIQRSRQNKWDHEFDMIDIYDDMQEMFEDRGYSLPIVILYKPLNTTDYTYSEPQNNCNYVRFTNHKWKL